MPLLPCCFLCLHLNFRFPYSNLHTGFELLAMLGRVWPELSWKHTALLSKVGAPPAELVVTFFKGLLVDSFPQLDELVDFVGVLCLSGLSFKLCHPDPIHAMTNQRFNSCSAGHYEIEPPILP